LFVVCQDIFLTESAQIADVVLPAAQWSEKTGCFTNVDRTVHIAHKTVEPPEEAKPDLDIFLHFAERMEFKDKDGQSLMSWKTSEEVFNEWRKMSKGRPCDYSGLSYEKLTGGSGIQWPCNETYPLGKERLFDDNVFFTDIDYCESFGHDMETGAPITKAQYQEMNPAGRAILKTAEYIPSLDACDDDYPLQLSTGRRVYQFHTRTKTGRAKALQDKAPDAKVEMNIDDAEPLGIKDGDEVIIKSRRGEVQMPVIITKIAQGQTFIPFHYGYFDKVKGSAATAANELTFGKSLTVACILPY
jgi:ferredoxin-nitrate reductase